MRSEGANGNDAIRLDLEDLPDLLLTDITLTDTNGFDAIAKIIKEIFTKIFICSVVGDASMVIDSLKSELQAV